MEEQEDASLASASEANKETKILSPLVRDALITVINQLRPVEFLKLSSACKGLREICLQSPGVSVEFKLGILVMDLKQKKRKKYDHIFDTFEALEEMFVSWDRIQKMLSFPFRFVIEALRYHTGQNVSVALMERTTRYLDQMGVTKIYGLDMGTAWPELIVMARKYNVERISGGNEFIPGEQVKEILHMKLKEFSYHYSEVDDEDLGNVNIPNLQVSAQFGKETAEKIIQRWLSKDLVICEWTVYSRLARIDLQPLFRPFPTIYCDWYSGPLLGVRPLVIVKEHEGQVYYSLVRDDNTILNVFVEHRKVTLTTEYNMHEPEILKSFIN